jgi:peptide alpha-N-acetyltransferase
MTTKARNQPLPAKEETLFRLVVKMYESKQHKKGLKAADQVCLCRSQ